jgi:hypothetical protein
MSKHNLRIIRQGNWAAFPKSTTLEFSGIPIKDEANEYRSGTI